jgi:uncharacterized protein YuzE
MEAYLIKGYQKKITFDPRTDFDYLLAEEAKDSDDNIDTVF